MNKILTSIIFTLIISLTTQAQNFTKKWQKVYQLEIQGKTKSAYEEVLKIHNLALAKKNDIQQVKSFIYLSNFKNILFEKAETNFFSEIQKEINISSEIGKAFLYQYYAIQLNDHFNDDYNILYRDKMTDRNSIDISLWDKEKFETEIFSNFEKSIANKELLSSLKVADFKDLITQVDSYFIDNNKNVYQFFIENYINTINKREDYAYYDKIDFNAFYFSKSETYTLIDFKNIPSNSLKKTAELYQVLEKSSTENPSKFTIDRLKFFNSICNNQNENFKAIEKLHNDVNTSNEFDLFYAELLINFANKNEYKYNNFKALDILNKLTSNKTNPKIYTDAHNLKETVLAKELHTRIKKEVYPNENFKAFITYKNIDTLSISYYKINVDNKYSFKNDSLVLEYMNTHQADKSFFKTLTKKNDYLSYTTEILLEPVDSGNYLIVIGTPKKNGNYSFSYNILKCNALDYFKEEKNGVENFYFRDRKTGKPLSNVFIRTDEKTYQSDENGKFSITHPKYDNNKKLYSYPITLIHEKDTISTSIPYDRGGYYYDNNYKDDEEIDAKAYVYFDRAIYRPGQKMYYKGIITQVKNYKSSVVPNLTVKVEIENPDGETVKTLEVQTNEFGSFSGEFDIPANGLTGEYEITIDEPETIENDSLYYNEEEEEHRFWDNADLDYDNFYFKVEEYKRPTFEVKMDKITTEWKLGDTIILKGKAIGLAGNTISDAEVKANINYSFKDVSKSVKNINKDFNTKTKTDGTFEIEIPTNELSDNNGNYYYAFYTNIDVIDINGETRNTRQNAFISNKEFNLEVFLPYNALKEEKKEIVIQAKTLNGVEKQVKGKLNIYKIVTDENIFKRKFGKPEIETIDSLTFAKLYPFEVYNDNEKPRKDLLKTIDFDTKTNTIYNLDFLEVGQYSFEAVAFDGKQNKIETTREITINTNLAHKPAESMFRFFISPTTKSNSVEIVFKSKINDLFITCFEYNENGKLEKEHLVQLQNGEGKLLFAKPQNRLALYFFAFYEDHFHSDEHTSYYNNERNKLKFEIISMRNKIEPGSTENWQFKILNSKLESEIVASMYDTSLDDFATLDWDVFKDKENRMYYPRFYKEYYSELDFYNNESNSKINFSFNTTNNLKWFHDEDLESKINSKKQKKSKHIISGNIQAKDEIPTEIFIKNTKNKKSTNTDFYGNFSIEGKLNNILDINIHSQNFKTRVTDTKNLKVKLNIETQPEIAPQSEFVVVYRRYIPLKSKKINIESKSVYFETYTVHLDTMDSGIEQLYVQYDTLSNGRVMEREFYTSNEEMNDFNYYRGNKKSYVSQTVIENKANTNFLTAIQGQVAGVNISSFSGQPGTKNIDVIIRGQNSLNPSNEPLYVIDGVPVSAAYFKQLNADDVVSAIVLKDAAATAIYGNRALNGVISITTKKAMQELTNVKTRKNFNETAFFKPHVKTDKDGKFTLEFTTPESLTRWRLNMLAHNKMAESELFSTEIIAQKDLMIIPNMPRFVRENDELVVTAKISNLLNEAKTGIAKLSLFDAGTGNPIHIFMEANEISTFNCLPKGSTVVQWKIKIPANIQGLQYKIVAKAGNFSDGEENILPVLKNAVLITESQPIWLKTNDTKTVTFDNLNQPSTTKENYKISINLVTNPIWSVMESLPYLMEYEHDCAEQTFSKLFANSISEKIVNDNPKIKSLLENWKQNPTSKLKMNEELKSVLLSETPWLVENNNELQKRVSNLLDVAKLKTTNEVLFNKLKEKQSSTGGFSWFGVGNENEYITRHILSGIGHLNKLNPESITKFEEIVSKGISYLDSKFETSKTNRIVNTDLHYMYARSFFLKAHPLSTKQDSIQKLQLADYKKNWLQQSLYQKTILALVLHRFDDRSFAKKIIEHLRESTILDETKGMFWKENTNGYYWYQSNIELQALIIEAFAEIDYKANEIEAMKVWLINNKQNKNWNTTKSSALAINAIISFGKDWMNSESKIQINDGKNAAIQQQLNSKLKESENGLINLEIKKEDIAKSFTGVKLENKGITPVYGGVYYQYFENLDKITATSNDDYSIKKEILKDEKVITTETLKVGDLVTIRLTFKTEKELEFVHVKDLRASCFEPVDVLSETKWINNTYYYMSTKDVASHFFFDNLPKGTYVLDYKVRVNNEGEFSDGYANLQSMYAPEFSAHSNSGKIKTIK